MISAAACNVCWWMNEWMDGCCTVVCVEEKECYKSVY
jgi:hypothetical protein